MAQGRPPAPTVIAAPGRAPGSVEEVIALVRRSGGRVTLPRRLLLEALFRGDAHHSATQLADEIHSVAPEVNRSTIYRNLEELERLGVVVHSHLGHGPATYHLASWAHAHLVCETCGAATEAPPDAVAELARVAAERLGFEVDPFHFAVPGRCASCTASAPASRLTEPVG